MENLFDTLKANLPAPSTQENLQPDTKASAPVAGISPKMTVKEAVMAWQKDPNEANTAAVLARMQPTITSAMATYARGNENRLAIKAANLTLKALKNYDPEVGTEPSTYVFHVLKRLARYNAASDYVIPRPEAQQLEKNRIQYVYDSFVDMNDREPSVAELADKTGFSIRKIQKLMTAPTEVSESATLAEDSGKDTQGFSDLTDDDYYEYAYSSVGALDQKIMDWSSGKHGKRRLSNNDIARRLRISPAAVSQRKGRLQGLLSDIRGNL